MNLRRLLLTCFCLFVIQDVVAQVYYIDRRFWNGNDANKTKDQPIEFDLFPYQGSMLDLREFQLRHPEIAGQVPEYLEIVPPDISGLREPGFAVAWVGVQGGNEEEGQLLLMVVGNYAGDNPRYYPDRNLNRVFIDDGEPVVFFPGHTREKLVFEQANSKVPVFTFWLLAPEDFDEYAYRKEKKERVIPHPDHVPATVAETSPPPLDLEAAKLQAHPEKLGDPPLRRIGIRFGITFGLNRIQYSYLHASTGFPVDYEVSNSAKGLFINLNYRHKGFRAGLIGGLEHVLWWSSFKTIRVSDPFEICDPQTGHCRHVEGVEVERNRDRLPELRLNLGINLECLFEFIPRVRVGPYLSPMISSYRPSHYLPEVVFPEKTYRMGPDLSFEGGLRAEVRPTEDQAFVFSACWAESRFRPAGFFEAEPDIRMAGLYSQYRGLRAYLGYSILL